MLFFKFPFAENIYTTDGTSGQNAVSFFSFDKSERLDFKADIVKVTTEEFLSKSSFSEDLNAELHEFNEENEADYTEKLQSVITFVKEHQLPKLVISRRKLIDFKNAEVNLSQTFLNLTKAYPNAFVYFFIKDGQCWLGAFSELLGKFSKATAEFETMALAGTLSIDEHWSAKEIEEQQPVSDFIEDILKKYAPEVRKSPTVDHVSGNIKHLRTDFKAEIQPEDLEKIISELHPTPAVCGIPKDFCQNAIMRFEVHPRRFYAGYIKVETEETVQYFVNLRCAEFFRNAALIYVGGGITADSIPQREWRETELKSEAVGSNIHFVSAALSIKKQ